MVDHQPPDESRLAVPDLTDWEPAEVHGLERRYNHANPDGDLGRLGRGRLLICNPRIGHVGVHSLDAAEPRTFTIRPGTIYAAAADAESPDPLVLTDYCNPPFRAGAGMETPVAPDDPIALPEFWEQYLSAEWAAPEFKPGAWVGKPI